MKKKLYSAIIFAAFAFMQPAKAEYLGINDLAMKTADSPIAFMNAVKGLQFDVIKQWLEQGYDLSYSGKEWCVISNTSFSRYPTPPTNTDEYISALKTSAMTSDTLALLPTSCDTIPMVRVAAAMNSIYSVDVAKYSSKLRTSKDFENQKKFYDMYMLLSKHLPESAYEEYIPAIMNSSVPASLRQYSLEKYLAGFKQKDAIMNKDEKAYQDTVIEAVKAEEYHPRLSNMINIITNPGYVMMKQFFFDFAKFSSDYAAIAKNHAGLPVIKMSDIKNGGIDLSKYNFDGLSNGQIDTIIQLNGVMGLIKTLLDSGIYDINSQDVEGNTVLHYTFDSRIFYKLKYSPYAGSFVRYFLENNANPLLENKESKTPYLLFEEAKKNDSGNYQGIDSMNNAFIQKDFKDE